LEEKGFNVTQGLALLLLKPLNLPANLVLKLIIFITDPKNDIGYKARNPSRNSNYQRGY